MTLFTYHRTRVSLADALGPFLDEAVALVYAPRWCGFARLVEGNLIGFDGPVPADTYEVRVFHLTAELRWLKDPAFTDGAGTAAILSDEPLVLGASWNLVARDPKKPVTETNVVTYLLWGEGTEAKQSPPVGWSILGTARIGALCVPLAKVERGERVLLHAIEYIAEDEFGSAFVCEERLTHLEHRTGNSNG